MPKIIEQKLFADSKTFVKDRPKSLTESQEEKFYSDMASEIIKGGWSKSDKETISEDLKEVDFYLYDNGYEIAKELESNCNGSYTFDLGFLEFLDNLYSEKNERITKNVEAWVKAHDIKPKYNLHDKLHINSTIDRTLSKSKDVYITGFRYSTGKYIVNENPEKIGNGYLVNYEIIEKNCTVIK